MANSGQSSTALDEAVVEGKLARWATWPVGAARGGSALKSTAITVVVAVAIVGTTWMLSTGGEAETGRCNGNTMKPGDVCIFYNPERTLTYEQMMQRAADAQSQSHPFAWTITVVTILIAAAIIWFGLKRRVLARTPSSDELDALMKRVNVARQELEDKAAATPGDREARQKVAVFDRALNRFAAENGFRVNGNRAFLD